MYLDGLFGWDHIRREHIYALLVVLCIMYFAIFYAWQSMRKRYDLCEKIERACVLGCPSGRCPPDWMRGDSYALEPGTKPKCLFTTWELSHFIFHGFIGYFFNLWVSLAVGVSFELYEYAFLNCESLIDIVANTAGCMVGAALRH